MINKENSKTKTWMFLVPGLGIDPLRLDECGLINAYLGDVDSEVDEDVLGKEVYLLFLPENPQLLGALTEDYEEVVVDEYDHEGGHVMIVCAWPKQWAEEMELFLKGKYSRFSKEYKELFARIPSKDEAAAGLDRSFAWRVFEKDPVIRKVIEDKIGQDLPENSEVASAPKIEDEIFDIRKFLVKEENNQ